MTHEGWSNKATWLIFTEVIAQPGGEVWLLDGINHFLAAHAESKKLTNGARFDPLEEGRRRLAE
jgi:hypothetical protein